MPVILNIEMPKCCMDCPFSQIEADPPHCLVTAEPYDEYFDIFHKRMPGCPLTRVTNSVGSNVDRCVCCGEIVPEGTMVCKKCISKYMD